MADFVPFGIQTELLEEIFTHLTSWKDFASLELVNKTFKEISWRGVTRLTMEITRDDDAPHSSVSFNGKKITADPMILLEVFCSIWNKCPLLTDLRLEATIRCGISERNLAAAVMRKILDLSESLPRRLTRLALDDVFALSVHAPDVLHLFTDSLVSLKFYWSWAAAWRAENFFHTNFKLSRVLFQAVGKCRNLKRFYPCCTHVEVLEECGANFGNLFGKMLADNTSLEKLDVSRVYRHPLGPRVFTVPDEVAEFLAKYQLEKAAIADGGDTRLHLVIRFDVDAGWELNRFASSLKSSLEAHGLDRGLTVLKDLTIHGVLDGDANYDLKPLYALLPSLKHVDFHAESESVDPSEVASEFLNFFSDAGWQSFMVIYMSRGGNSEAMVSKFDEVLPKVEEKAGVLGHMYLEPYETCCGETRGLCNRARIHKGYADVWIRME